MSLSQQIPAEVFVDSYPTRVWYRGMAPEHDGNVLFMFHGHEI